MKILVVVDMQPCFVASQDPTTIKNNIKQIKLAMKKQMPIVFLEYSHWGTPESSMGNTDKRLTDLVKDYDHYAICFKESDDGSDKVQEAIATARWTKPTTFYVTGVNTDACVKSTVAGLARKYPKAIIKVIKKACNTEYQHYVWARFLPKAKNVVLVPQAA